MMFRKYMSDLSIEVGITISNEIIAHILSVDDLTLFLDSITALLDGLLNFRSKNKIIVNETKTKVMCFGTDEHLYFNKKHY